MKTKVFLTAILVSGMSLLCRAQTTKGDFIQQFITYASQNPDLEKVAAEMERTSTMNSGFQKKKGYEAGISENHIFEYSVKGSSDRAFISRPANGGKATLIGLQTDAHDLIVEHLSEVAAPDYISGVHWYSKQGNLEFMWNSIAGLFTIGVSDVATETGTMRQFLEFTAKQRNMESVAKEIERLATLKGGVVNSGVTEDEHHNTGYAVDQEWGIVIRRDKATGQLQDVVVAPGPKMNHLQYFLATKADKNPYTVGEYYNLNGLTYNVIENQYLIISKQEAY